MKAFGGRGTLDFLPGDRRWLLVMSSEGEAMDTGEGVVSDVTGLADEEVIMHGAWYPDRRQMRRPLL